MTAPRPSTRSVGGTSRELAADKFYRRVLGALRRAEIPFLLAGAFALRVYTTVHRDTKDLDIFLRKRDLDAALEALREAGCTTELTYPHWLAKAYSGKQFIDMIFNMANGLAPIDDSWFLHAVESELLGQPVLILPAEDMICSKLCCMDRGRFDGADIAHLLRATAERLDWQRVLDRAGSHWRALLCHLVMFGYVYPAEQGRLPRWVLQELLCRLYQEADRPLTNDRVCRGTLLSPTQYRVDVEEWGYQDARLPPWGTMTPEEVRVWTAGVLAGK
jgi:hypothetical protein